MRFDRRSWTRTVVVILVTLGVLWLGNLPPFRPKEAADYKLTHRLVRQPLDHAAPQGAQFDELVDVLVPDGAPPDAPVLFLLGNESHLTPTKTVTAYHAYGSPKNVIFVHAEHRGYGSSVSADPDQTRPTYVSYTQALADYHRVAETLKPEFPGPWIAAGYSYGGGLSIQFGLDYPQDVKAVLSSSGVVDWKFAIPEYDRQVRLNLGPDLYDRLTKHAQALQPETTFDANWHDRDMLYAFVVAMTQYSEFQHLKPVFGILATLPTKLFLKTLHWLDHWMSGDRAWYYATGNGKTSMTRDEVTGGKYDWRIWRYAQCAETGTFFVSADSPGVFTYTRDELIANCKALFGEEPRTAGAIVWPLRPHVKELTVPLVYVAAGKDPWRELGITSHEQMRAGSYIYAPDSFHCPDMRDPELGRRVLAAVLDVVGR